MPYTPTTWVNNTTPLDATNMNKIETGIAAAAATADGAIAKTIADAKGDLLVASAADLFARLAVGTQGYVLMAGASSAVAWAQMAQAVTALPSSPFDGQEIILMDSLTAPTYSWRFRYVSAKSSNKWVFVGGPPRHAEVATNETTTSTTFAALATAGPSVVVPVAGIYMVEIGAHMYPQSGADYPFMSFAIGGTGATLDDALWGGNAQNVSFGGMRRLKKTLTAVTLTSKYLASGGVTCAFERRWMSLTPVAVGG